MSISVPVDYYDNVEQYGNVGRGGITVNPPSNRVPGNMLLAVIGSYNQVASIATGWTQINSVGSAGSYLLSCWRIASGDGNDTLSASFGSSGGSYAAGITIVRSTLGFDSASIKSSSANSATGAGASYALSSGLTGVSAGEISMALGGNHNPTSWLGNTMGVSGASWTLDFGGGGFLGGPGGVMVAHNTVTGTPAVPSVTYNDTTHTYGRFIFAAVIREATASGLAGGGLFWGAP